MKQLQIVFTKSKKKLAIGSKAIMWYTDQEYSHVARGFKAFGDIQMYYQASEGKVNYEHESVFSSKHEIVEEYIIEIPDDLYRNIGRECISDAGKKYGFMQNIGILLVDTGMCEDNPWKDGRNCSELIYVNVLKKLLPNLDYNADTIKPHQIKLIIKKHFKQYSDGVCRLLV